MSVYEEIKNDPRAFIKQFAGIKRHTTYWMSDMGRPNIWDGVEATCSFPVVRSDSAVAYYDGYAFILKGKYKWIPTN